MNYITEINRFYDWLETNEISDSAIALWHALMHINNKCGWTEEFTVAMLTLQNKTRLSKSSIIRARKILVDKKRIYCIEQTGQRSPIYRIVPFHRDTQTDIEMAIMEKSVVHPDTQTGTQLRKKRQVVVQGGTQTVTDNKLNTRIKTKPSLSVASATGKKKSEVIS